MALRVPPPICEGILAPLGQCLQCPSSRPSIPTYFDGLGIPQQIRKQRLGHSGNSATENYTHAFTEDERDAAEKLGDFLRTGWPEIDKRKVISFPNLSQKEEGLGGGTQQALVDQ